MAFKAQREDVSLTFHYIKRLKKKKGLDGKEKLFLDPFTDEDFDALHTNLVKHSKRNIKDEKFHSALKARRHVRIEKIEKTERYIYGIYGNSYSGHEFDNSVFGTIPADSLNIRPFFFMLYHSEEGYIYIASQYLGNYGGYTTLKSTLYSFLGDASNLNTICFNTNGVYADLAEPKEVQISFSRKSKDIGKSNSYGRVGMFSFKKGEKDDGFTKKVKKDFFSLLKNNSQSERRKLIAQIMSNNNLYELTEEDIDDCKIHAIVNERTRTIQIFDDLNRASRFPVDVTVDKNGHPPYEKIKDETKKLLKTEIVSVKLNA